MPDIEIVGLRQENSKTFEAAQGKKMVVSMAAIHYKDNYSDLKEPWKDIDLTWKENQITKAPYTLTRSGNSVTILDKRTGKTSTIELLNPNKDLPMEIVAEPCRISFRHSVPADKLPFEVQFKISGDLPLSSRAFDDSGSIKVSTSIKDGVLTECIDTVLSSVTGLARAQKGTIKIDPNYTIATGANDGYVYDPGNNYSAADAQLYIGQSGGNVVSGWLRYAVSIPNSSTINTAAIRHRATNSQSGTTCLAVIYAEAADSPAAPTNYANYWAKTRTTAHIHWTVATWTGGSDYDSADISTVIQEIVNRAGWASGNYLNLFEQDDGSANNAVRLFPSYEASTSTCPILIITYTEPNVTITLAAVMAGTGAQTEPTLSLSSLYQLLSAMQATGAGVTPTGIVQAIMAVVMGSSAGVNTPNTIIRADLTVAMLATGAEVEPAIQIAIDKVIELLTVMEAWSNMPSDLLYAWITYLTQPNTDHLFYGRHR